MTDLEHSIVKTGTTTVGIVCKDGIILAADKRATADHLIADKRAKKVHKLSDNIAVTISGGVSDIQMVLKLTKAELELKRVRTKQLATVKEAANIFANIVYQNIRKFSTIVGISHFILGGKDEHGFALYDVTPDGAVSEHSDYATSGAYGAIIAYGILENEWKPHMTMEEGKKMAMKVLLTAIKRDASVGNGIDMVIIDKKGVNEIKETTLE
ncbi:MAG: proteasome subunit beta [Nanoarchaeota archaeon]|nr:proteasome subunit beta [Nanoarchaeota archaeon]